MGLESIGKNMRKVRKMKKLRQEDVAERTGLSTNYIGALERGEKIPSLESFIAITNGLSVSADILLADVIDTAYIAKVSLFSEQIGSVSQKDRDRIYDMVEVMLKYADHNK